MIIFYKIFMQVDIYLLSAYVYEPRSAGMVYAFE